ncbi:hypothetical protein A4G99_12690 [Haladaptatus sp. R4]|uniref:helix-turn-helix domain-containing protein n=1 Tax=Haladaptatus sp. R4 TaxID=1679489 RepID=UPI0007B4E6F2|nr:bacterio-opsin activator domain-containing protein [Haladaptatus sp. R4]KZN23721.1 hypothetical protein A4G99_12690 [Haladaptatus sp. R4]
MGTANDIGGDEILGVFERLDDPSEPLATSEVAEAVGCARRTAYDKLRRLADEGKLETKTIGAQARAWWRPAARPTASDAPAPETNRSVDDSEDEFPPELTADEVLELEFVSEQLARPFLELGHEDMDLRIDGFVRLPDGSHVQYWTVTGISGETVMTLPELFPTNEDVRLLKKEGDSYRVEVRGAASSLVSTYDELDGESVTTALEDGKIRNLVQFPATVDVAAVLDAIRDVAARDFELASQKLVYTPRLFKTLVKDDLTERQWTALQIAYYAGYFKVPRQSEGDEIAERMDITRQTFNYHLRHAQDTILYHLFEAHDDGIGESN